VREALRRIGEGAIPAGFGDQVVVLVLRALQAPSAEVTAVLARKLPALPPVPAASVDHQPARRRAPGG